MSSTRTITSLLASIDLSIDEQQHSIHRGAYQQPNCSENFIAILPYYGFLAIEGPDTAKFLQGQATCDTSKVTEKQSCNGALCSVKGRMYSSFHLARHDNAHYLLKMRQPLVETTLATLNKYIVFSKAKQYNASDDYIAIGLYGPSARAAIHASFGSCPDTHHGSIVNDGNIAIQMDTAGLMYECWVASGNIERLWPTLQHGLELRGSRSWELLTIQQGLGEICEATKDMFLPQMLNYQATNAISFTKGCYTGQEVVARMTYKGKLKRPMYRIRIATDMASSALQAGSDLFSTSGEQSIGNIVNIVNVDNNNCEALAVISSKEVEQNTVIAGKQKSTITLLPLPYAIT